jgi:exodeoxyribonuclease-3
MLLVSWNVNGLRAAWKKGFLDFLESQKADVVCVQETKIQAEQLTEEMRAAGGYRSYWAFAEKKGYSGVVTYLHAEPVHVATTFGSPALDVEGRIVHTELPEFHLLNVYFPNGGMGPERLAHKLTFYDEFLAFTEGLRKGDLARPKENEKTSGFMPEERAWVARFIGAGYCDTFRLFTAEAGHYTWWDMKTAGARARNVGWRIDYFFVSEELRGRVKSAGILPAIQGSDHCPITLTLE